MGNSVSNSNSKGLDNLTKNLLSDPSSCKSDKKSKSYDSEMNRIAKSRHYTEEMSNEDALQRRESKKAVAKGGMQVIPNLEQIRSAPFILKEETSASNSSLLRHSSQDPFAKLDLTFADGGDAPIEPFEVGRGTVDKINPSDPKDSSTTDGITAKEFTRTNSFRQQDSFGTPGLVRRETTVKIIPKLDVPESILGSMSGDLPPDDSRNVSMRSNIASIGSEDNWLGSMVSSTGRFSMISDDVQSSQPSVRWSLTDPIANATQVMSHFDVRHAPTQSSTSDMLSIIHQQIPKEDKNGLLRKRREIKQVMTKFNSCSTLFVDGILSNQSSKQALKSLSKFLEHQILQNTVSTDRVLKSEEIFSERLFPVSMQFQFYKIAPSADTIFRFIECIFQSAELNVEFVILSLIYIQRLLLNTGITIHPSNWARIVLGGIALAAKVWDDHAVWNIDFCQIFPDIKVENMNALEKRYLQALHYNINVRLSTYTRYYFALREFDESPALPKPVNLTQFKLLKTDKLGDIYTSKASTASKKSASSTHRRSTSEQKLKLAFTSKTKLTRTTSELPFHSVDIPAYIL